MPGDVAQLAWLLALTWFLLYWVLGGMLFAMVSLTRLLRVKTAQFSCLFTIACAAAAYGATATGIMLTSPKAVRCIDLAMEAGEWTKAFGCGVKEIFFIGGGWFALLVLLSILLMVLSQRDMFPTRLGQH